MPQLKRKKLIGKQYSAKFHFKRFSFFISHSPIEIVYACDKSEANVWKVSEEPEEGEKRGDEWQAETTVRL